MKTQLTLILPVLLALMLAPASAAVRYVNLVNPNPTPPYTDWASAATNIQDAIDAADPGDEIVVTNGVYATGGRVVDGPLTNRVAVTKPVTVRSVNGPEVTVIRGYQAPGTTFGDAAVRCVYLTNDATLVGFMLTNGATAFSCCDNRLLAGGGVFCANVSAMVSNCVFAGNSAAFGGGAYEGTLNNCMLTGNSAFQGGGAYQCALNNCTLTGNVALHEGGGAYSGTLNHCTLTANSAAHNGGGVCNVSNVNNCTLATNLADYGGGAYSYPDGALSNCTLEANSARLRGGGAYYGTLNNCTLKVNSASGSDGGEGGGGAYFALLNNCTLTGNFASFGGGALGATLNNCALSGNSATNSGGGAYQSWLTNCTLTGNSAGTGGGVVACKLNNCIVYYNVARLNGENNYDGLYFNERSSTFEYSCTTPLPRGVGNISAEPQLANSSHLSAGSPCRGLGASAYATGQDIDGEAWSTPPAIGCDEFYSAPATGPLSVAIAVSYNQVATGFELAFTAQIGGRATLSRWEFGDGTVVSNRPYSAHSWANSGDYRVVLWAYNQSHPGGVSATAIVHVVEQPVHYVAVGSSNPLAPYSSWATAATTIQDAVDAASTVGALVLVNNGVYQTGGRVLDGVLTNRVAVSKPVTVRSVNGPEVTVIQGYHVPGAIVGDGAVRCVYLTHGATLAGFTLTNGATRGYLGNNYLNDLESTGGGVWCAGGGSVVSNCVLNGNAAEYGGGAASHGTLNHCTFTGNRARWFGGGVSDGTLDNCTLSGNSSTRGGGAVNSTLNNCTLTGNSAVTGGGAVYLGVLHNCTLTGNSCGVGSAGGGAEESTLDNCTLKGNSASSGGGAAHSVLSNCTLTENPAIFGGGGAFGGTLYHCTLTRNSADSGGGAAGGSLYNCILSGNSASNGGGIYSGTLNTCVLTGNSARDYGGGGYGSTLSNCLLEDNSAGFSGGGSFGGTLNNCTLIGNWANQTGGGAGGRFLPFFGIVSKLNNCIVYYNVAGQEGDNYNSFSELNRSCTTPLPPAGQGNFENRPRLVDLVGGDFRLQPDSPCINAGLNIYAPNGTDLDGNPRIVGGTVDVGAYEFQSPQSLLSYAWLQQFGLPNDGSADNLDLDGDDFTNYQEWRAGTDPTDPLSALRLLTPERSGRDLVIGWASMPGRDYFLERSTNLTSSGSFIPLARNIPGQTDSTTYTDANVVTNGERYFYRVGVE